MKTTICKALTFLAASAICVALSACGEKGSITDTRAPDETESESQTDTERKAYTFRVSPMQGIDDCIYYGPNDYVPNSPDPEAARNKIHVWTKCPTCGSDGDHLTIPVDELDFSGGDTLQYSDSCQCYDCYWERDIKSYLWTVRIERIPEPFDKQERDTE